MKKMAEKLKEIYMAGKGKFYQSKNYEVRVGPTPIGLWEVSVFEMYDSTPLSTECLDSLFDCKKYLKDSGFLL